MRAMLPVLVLAALRPSAAADGEAEVILGKVAQTYASLRTYSLKVHNDVGSDVAVDSFVNDFELTFRDGSHFAYTVRTSPSLGPLTVVRDGETVWTYNAQLREYMEEPGDVGGVRTGSSYGVGIFARANAQLVNRFVHLTGFIDTARLAGRERLRDGFFEGEAILVELRPPRGQRDQRTERIWIDPRTNLVVKSVSTKPGSDSNTFHYSYRLLNEPVPDEFFGFRPPRNAKRVKKFSPIPRPLG